MEVGGVHIRDAAAITSDSFGAVSFAQALVIYSHTTFAGEKNIQKSKTDRHRHSDNKL